MYERIVSIKGSAEGIDAAITMIRQVIETAQYGGMEKRTLTKIARRSLAFALRPSLAISSRLIAGPEIPLTAASNIADLAGFLNGQTTSSAAVVHMIASFPSVCANCKTGCLIFNLDPTRVGRQPTLVRGRGTQFWNSSFIICRSNMQRK